jgi:hypothetical protein
MSDMRKTTKRQRKSADRRIWLHLEWDSRPHGIASLLEFILKTQSYVSSVWIADPPPRPSYADWSVPTIAVGRELFKRIKDIWIACKFSYCISLKLLLKHDMVGPEAESTKTIKLFEYGLFEPMPIRSKRVTRDMAGPE